MTSTTIPQVISMFRKAHFSPAPLALALLVAAAFSAVSVAPAAASGDSHAATASVPAAKQVRHIKLSTGLVGGKMVFLDEKGQPNARLRANVGTR